MPEALFCTGPFFLLKFAWKQSVKRRRRENTDENSSFFETKLNNKTLNSKNIFKKFMVRKPGIHGHYHPKEEKTCYIG